MQLLAAGQQGGGQGVSRHRRRFSACDRFCIEGLMVGDALRALQDRGLRRVVGVGVEKMAEPSQRERRDQKGRDQQDEQSEGQSEHQIRPFSSNKSRCRARVGFTWVIGRRDLPDERDRRESRCPRRVVISFRSRPTSNAPQGSPMPGRSLSLFLPSPVWAALALALFASTVAGAERPAPSEDPEAAAQLGIPAGLGLRPSLHRASSIQGAPSTAAAGDSNGVWLDTPPPRRFLHAAIYDPLRDRMLVFGGEFSQFTAGTLALSLEGDPAWSSLFPSGGSPPPLGRGYYGFYDSGRDRLIVFGGSGPYGGPLGLTWQLNLSSSPQWSALGASQLGPREGSAVAFDSKRDRCIVFGGRDSVNNDEVWTLDVSAAGSSWTRLDVQGAHPLARAWSQALYDPEGDRLIVFGGTVEREPHILDATNETWVLDLAGTASWTELDTLALAPPALTTGVTVYDPVERRMLLVGHAAEEQASDLWELSLTDTLRWTKRSAVGILPIWRSGHTAVYDSKHDRILVFGGQLTPLDAVGVDVLSLRPQLAWSRLSSTELPRGRFGHATIHDWKRDRLLFFGGVASTGFFGPGEYVNETWSISLGDLTDIRRVQPTGDLPPPRHEPVGIYDPVEDRSVFFCGLTYPDNYFYDTWVLSFQQGSAWQRVYPLGDPPPPRRAHAATYDPVRRRMLLWGGYDDNGPRE